LLGLGGITPLTQMRNYGAAIEPLHTHSGRKKNEIIVNKRPRDTDQQ